MSSYAHYDSSRDSGVKAVNKRFNNHKAAKARKDAKTTKKIGSSANPVQRMGLGSIYDKITVDNTSTSAPAATGGSGGGYRRRSYGGGGGGGGGGYSGPTAAELAAAAAAQAAAYRAQIMQQYIVPTNTLYDEAVKAAESDKIRSRQAFDRARADVNEYTVNTNRQTDRDQRTRDLAYQKFARQAGLDGEIGLNNALARGTVTAGSKKVINRNQDFSDATAKSFADMYGTQKANAVGRTQAFQDEQRRQQKLQRDQIARTYGIKL